MIYFTGALIFLTIVLILLTLGLIYLPIYQEKTRKSNDINKLLTELDSLDIELETNSDIIKGMLECQEKCINSTTTMRLPVENLKKNLFNENLRNRYLKKILIILYFNIDQKNNALMIRDDPEYKRDNINDLRTVLSNIGVLREAISEFKDCIERKKDLDSCGDNYGYTIEIG